MNGKKWEGPLLVYRNGVLYETSFVTFGADDQTSAEILAKRFNDMTITKFKAPEGVDTKSKRIRNRRRKAGISASEEEDPTEEDEQDENTPSEEDEEKDPSESDESEEDNPEEDESEEETIEDSDEEDKPTARKAKSSRNPHREREARETERIAAIRKVAKGYPKIEAAAIREGWSRDKTELAILKADKERNRRMTPPSIRQGNSGGPDRAQVIAASALMGLGWRPETAGKHFSEKVMNEAVAASNRGFGMNRIVAECVRSASDVAGVHVPSMEGLRGEGMWQAYTAARQSLMANHKLMASGNSFSTVSLPGILSNVINKTLLEAYDSVPSVLRQIASRGSSNDFKPAFSYRIYLEGGKMKKVPSTGKIEGTTLGEESYERGIDTIGDLITITRKMIINDDLGALAKIPAEFGNAAAQTIESEGFEALIKGQSKLFTAKFKNLVTTNKKFDHEGLAEAAKLFMEMTGPSGLPISVKPEYLLVSPALWTEATLLTSSPVFNQAPADRVPAMNPWANMFTVMASPYLSTAQGGNDKAWYMLAAPSRGSVINLSFLGGRETPIIEQENAAFDVLGVSWRIYHDYGVNLEDGRMGVYSPGA